jgi:hypothetical protein
VDSKYIKPAPLEKYLDTLSSSERKSKLVKVKVLGLIAGRKSYECQVIGIADKVTLSSKSLVTLQRSGSRQNEAQHRQNPSDDNSNASEVQSEDSDDEEGSGSTML